MKPTPSKVVLLMSAAGLGLSWSDAALAARDGHVPASVALTFGAAPKAEQGCDARSDDAWMLCPAANGELVRTIVAQTAALPLPLPTMGQAGEAASSPAVAVDAAQPAARMDETGAADGEPAPDDRVPLPESPVAARGVDDSGRDPEAEAIAMILLVDPQGVAGDAAAIAEAAPARVPASMASPTLVGDAVVAARSEPAAAAAAEDAQAADAVLAALAEVLGATLDVPAAGIEVQPMQAAAAEVESPAQASVPTQTSAPAPALATSAERTPEQLTVAAATVTGAADSASLQRASEAEEIVVAPSHTEKVLMSLSALRSGASPEPGTNKAVVVRHTDKVLETLALFRPRKTNRATMACTGADDEDARVVRLRDFDGPTAATALAGIGPEPDILLDLQLPVSGRDERPVPKAAAAAEGPPAPPVAERTQIGPMGSSVVALSTDRLDEVRGGFVTEGGLKVSFGIERAVYLNGALVATTSLNISDLSKISGGQAQVSGDGTAATLAVLQSGAGNVFAPGSISSTAAGTVIQNTLDNQKINTITRIDAVVNSSGIMRAINLQSSMQSAIVNSLRR